MRPENDNQGDVESGYQDDDVETSYRDPVAKEAFLTGFTSGALLTMGITYLVCVVIPGGSCP